MKNLFLVFVLLTSLPAFAQTATQTLRGKITDEVSKTPVIGATVLVIMPDAQTPLGTSSDVNGDFKLTQVPLGRQTLRISYIGYEEIVLPNVVVTAGKEVILNVSLTEKVSNLNEVTVTYDRSKDNTVTNNELSTVSTRSFNIDDTKRYAGSLGDPSRMAANFAGVVSGNDSRNDIVVRGNSPSGMLWQLEGLNIPNPNHFGSLSSTGGPVSILNNNVLGKSDFMTSAFPAQYGNGVAGVFDLKMRNGNNEKSEFLGQVGFNGFELGAEGPFSKTSKASYLINYRYSTLGAFKALGINFGTGNAVPNYQDLNAKIFIPTGTKGRFSVFAVGGRSDITLNGNDTDTTKTDLYGDENSNSRLTYATNIAGASYEYNLSPRTFAKLTLGLSTTNQQFEGDSISPVTRQAFLNGQASFKTRKYSAVLAVNHKFDARNSLNSGVTMDLLSADLYNRSLYNAGKFDTVRVNVQGETTVLTQAYTQWKHRLNPRLFFTAGIHFQHYSLTNSTALEPRAGLKYAFGNSQSIGFGYGLHSQLQNVYTYFVQTPSASGLLFTNKNLGFTKSHHLVLSYENNLTDNLHLKAETYYQSVFNAQVEQRRSSFSSLNTGANFAPQEEDSLVNNGTGHNYGVELTLERYFSKGYYFLATTSFFDSKYKGSDGVERNTAFNTHYVFNVLVGKEVKVGRKKSNVLAVNLRLSTVGGRYFSPLNVAASRSRGEAVYDGSRAYSQQQTPYFRTDLKLAYRKELAKSTLEIALDLQNLSNNKNIFQQTYNTRTQGIANQYQQGFFPVPFVRYTF